MSQGMFTSSCCKPTAPTASAATAATAATSHKPATEMRGLATGSSRPRHHHHRGRHHHHWDGASGSVRRRNVRKSTPQHAHDIVVQPVEYGEHGNGNNHDHGDAKEPCCTTNPLDSCPKARFAERELDMEKAAGHERVSVAITGMDCTSCGDKLARVLRMTHGVSEARVNFITGRADFTINTTLTNADQAVRLAASGSGFRLTRMIGGDNFLDVSVSPHNAKELAREPPSSVMDVHVLDKKTLRLAYDPTVIGSRALFDSISDKIQGLSPPRSDPQLESGRRRLWDQTIKTGLAALFTIPVVVLSWGEDLTDAKTKAIVSVILGTMVQGIAIPEFYRPALSTLIYSRVVEMDMLVVISITAAFAYSVVAFGFQMANQPLGTSEFFETSTLLITLILFGRLIATFVRVRAIAAVSVRSMQSNTAVLVEKGRDREIDARLLQYGDQFRVLPHSRVPTDGTILQGSTEIDESMLTGEVLPVLKQVGDPVIAGTVNGDGTVLVQLDRLPGKNTVTDIAQLVDEAANAKPRIQDLADKVAGWFVPVVSTIAIIVLVIWIAVGMEVLDYGTSKAVLEAVTYFVATLAVACPCALGLAVPMVLVAAGGIAARGGIIIKSAETTERARKATDIIFDKTGTITEGDLVVVGEEYLSEDKVYAATMAKALVAGGKHPVSAAVDKYLEGFATDEKLSSDVLNVCVIPGAGIEAELGNKRLRAGHPRWTMTDSHPKIRGFQDDGLTTLVVTLDSIPLVAFGLRTKVRFEASHVIAELKARNIKVHLVSGDQTFAVKAVASTVGIPDENVAAERTPSQKRDYVASLMEDSSRYVIFCGDGTNDAVAVAQANVGVQIGGSLTTSDVTQTAADAVLLNGLEGILFLLNVSHAAFNRMAFNFVWSAIYNVLTITMASGAWVKFRIPPAYAGLGEFISVLPVIAASMTLFLVDLKQPSTAATPWH